MNPAIHFTSLSSLETTQITLLLSGHVRILQTSDQSQLSDFGGAWALAISASSRMKWTCVIADRTLTIFGRSVVVRTFVQFTLFTFRITILMGGLHILFSWLESGVRLAWER